MKIGILHLTDMHLTSKSATIDRTKLMCDLLISDFHDIQKLYILISGDIAFSGKSEEYKVAKQLVSTIKLLFKEKHPGVEFGIILVPGNHDCNFDLANDLRKTVLKNINYQNIGSDDSIIDLSLGVQQDFWDFYLAYNPKPNNKMLYQIVDKIEGKSICFTCINTSWMSQYEEVAGSLFFPVKKYEELANNSDHALNIAVWHHPANWFNPNTNENNKKEFEKFIEKIAPIHFIGHEHENEHYLNINQINEIESHIISGKLFNDDRKKECGFNSIKIELADKETFVKSYYLEDKHFKLSNEKKISLDRKISKTFNLREDFKNDLNDIKIPLILSNKKEIKLAEVYVYPDMESVSSGIDLNKLESFQDSSRLTLSEYDYCIIEGDEQIGKSTLLGSLFLQSYIDGSFPLLIKGSEIKSLDTTKILKKALSKQYIDGFDEFEKYLQIDKSKRVLLIDDYQDTELNPSSTKEILTELGCKFGKILITISSSQSIIPTMQTDFPNWKFFGLKPFGYKKRNDLIEKYLYLKENPITIDEHQFLENTKLTFDNVQNILGDKLMPSYPVFILSILQALEYKPIQQNETSYGYCYQTLIHYSLHNAGVNNDDIDTYFNFLTELAYHFVAKDLEYISRKEFDSYYLEYKKDYIIPNYEIVLKTIKNSKIIFEKEDSLYFGYKYILYYLSAKKISDVIDKPEGKAIIKKLFKKVHIEKNASILVFVTHHSKDISFIEESMMNSMIILDSVNPITLEKHDPFYDSVRSLVEEVKQDVLEINRNPKDERRKFLKIRDEQERANERSEQYEDSQNDKDVEPHDIILPFQQAFRSIEIIGQIVRNRKGSLPKGQLQDMIKEIYTTGFRTVSYVSEMLNNSKDDIIATLVDESGEYESRSEAEFRISQFIQMMCLQTCLGVFTKLMYSVGNKDLKEIYKNVATELSTPAAKLVSFGINSHYGNFSIKELKAIEIDLRGNTVALNLLKARVKSYVYNKKVDYKIKQQIAATLNMTIGPVSNVKK
jgi:hypothetical protein